MEARLKCILTNLTDEQISNGLREVIVNMASRLAQVIDYIKNEPEAKSLKFIKQERDILIHYLDMFNKYASDTRIKVWEQKQRF